MEPFGIFNFLKTLLSLEENSSSTAVKNENISAVDNTPAASIPSSIPAPQTVKNMEDTSAQNAYLLFLEQHDRRAKKARKP
ncbi:MAG: hypothetical protein E7366_03345 [Clostridiales bacterium]|nr:hypothetical protein [Clostridiales bacterium]